MILFLSAALIHLLLIMAQKSADRSNLLPNASFALSPCWPEPRRENRPWTRWWWFGSAVTQAGLTAALEELAMAGVGGVEICPVYGARGHEGAFLDFLSPEWVAMFAHACREGERLGMGVDLTTGTGWPFGGPGVGDKIASGAMRLKYFVLPEGESLQEELPEALETLMAIDAAGGRTNLLPLVRKQRLLWSAPAGGAELFGLVRTGPVQKVKRAAPGGEGFVLDPFSEVAMAQYLGPFDRMLKELDAPRPRAHFHDSFEYYGANWTPQLAEEFVRRRGYDLYEYVPELFGHGEADVVRRVRCDYRQTLGELHLDYIGRWSRWTRSGGSLSRNQAHGVPGNIIDLYAAADIPETEVFGDADERLIPMLKLASSAAHLTGRALASSESFTWLGEHFQTSLANLRPEAELLFLCGLNHLFFHGTPYSPVELPWPGWLFYASTHLGREGGLWRDLPAFNSYLTRCQSILQEGAPSPDVLLYFPVSDFWQGEGDELLPWFKMPGDWMWNHDFHRMAMELRSGGWDYDAISDRLLLEGEVAAGQILVGGTGYGALVIPSARVMPLDTARKMVELAKAGATVIICGRPPEDVPGLVEVEQRRAALREVWRRVGLTQEENGAGGEFPVGDGRFLQGMDLPALLAVAGAGPEPMSRAGLQWIRRQRADGYDYFVANRGTNFVDGWIGFGRPFAGAQLLDPLEAQRIGRAAVRQEPDGAEVYLQLAPGDSMFVRTVDDPSEALAEAAAWRYLRVVDEPVGVVGTWEVAFLEGGPVLPGNYLTDRLGSWHESSDPEAKRFAGTACYRIQFQHDPGARDEWVLDLGKVAESARVRLNGVDLGCWWARPFRRSVGGFLRAGENLLEVEVTNLAANRIADLDRRQVPWKNFHEINFVNRQYQPFDASGWPPRPSGLIGPVRLWPAVRFDPGCGAKA
jgi:hypothetical protein